MTGRVTQEQAEWYDEVTPEGTTYKKATLDYDPIAKRQSEAKKKFKQFTDSN